MKTKLLSFVVSSMIILLAPTQLAHADNGRSGDAVGQTSVTISFYEDPNGNNNGSGGNGDNGSNKPETDPDIDNGGDKEPGDNNSGDGSGGSNNGGSDNNSGNSDHETDQNHGGGDSNNNGNTPGSKDPLHPNYSGNNSQKPVIQENHTNGVTPNGMLPQTNEKNSNGLALFGMVLILAGITIGWYSERTDNSRGGRL